MSLAYAAVGWNRQKRVYDLLLGGGIVLYLVLFVVTGAWRHPTLTIETLLIRALGSAGLVLLHVVLSIGPLARLDRRFLPLLFNRRHMGVSMFLLALAHASFATVQYHALGDTNPLVSVLTSNRRVGSLAAFPFELLGAAALAILFLMAATSHDFWLRNLTPRTWKTLHMGVYAAYALLLLHVALGVVQAEPGRALPVALGAGFAWIAGLHLVAGYRERAGDRDLEGRGSPYVDVCAVDDIAPGRARAACLAGERVAVYRHDGGISAVSAVCRHQNGPLAEGRIVDGCITCPWHGWQYRPETGAAPPPFTEKLATYRVRVEGGRVLVDPRPLPPGTHVDPASQEAPRVASR